MEQQMVVFALAHEHFSVDIASVEGIVMLQEITKEPHAPSFVEGVTNLRGSILPVIDLRKRFGLAFQGTTKDTRIIVVTMNNKNVGMIVDGVSEVLTVSEQSIKPPAPKVTTVDPALIVGMAKVDERLIILLDLAKVLTSQEQAELHAMVS
jgi:purine-binding chemotaxis protein CheW